MSMTETNEAPKPPRRKLVRRKPRAAAAPVPKPASELAGLTPTNCPAACGAERCVISGRGVCGHPYKGGLQGGDMHNPDAINRLTAAKRMLGKQKVDLRNPT